MSLEKLINQSKRIIRSIDKRSKDLPLICNFSGGKDSQALLSLMLEVSDNVEALFMASGLDLPESIPHVKREIKKYGVKLHITNPVKDYMGDFSYWLRKIGYFPAISYCWCSGRLKIRPARSYLRKLFGYETIYKFNGVRRFESSRRMRIYRNKKGFLIPDGEHSGSYAVVPLLNWRSHDIKQFLDSRNITINQDYKAVGVSGCFYCPFYQPYIYLRINGVYPGIYDEILSLEDEIGKPSVVGNKFLRKVLRQKRLDEFF